MICAHCAAGADLATAVIELPAQQLTERVRDVIGRPFVATIARHAVQHLHAGCTGCDCQHASRRRR